MRIHKVITSLSLVFLFFIQHLYLNACMCFPPTVEKSYRTLDEIFIGTAKIIDSIEVHPKINEEIKYHQYTIQINALTKFKGGSASSFYYKTGDNSCDLSRDFFQGQQSYLFYFKLDNQNSQYVRLDGCDRNVAENVSFVNAKKGMKQTKFKNDIDKLKLLNPNPLKFEEPKAKKISLYLGVSLIIIILYLAKRYYSKRHNK